MLPIDPKIAFSNLERNPATILPKAFLPLDPANLQGLNQGEIDKLVPSFASKGVAVDGGPKWSWVDAWGFRWEIRFHPDANFTFPSRPSGCGSIIRFGMQIVPNPFGYEEILSMDRSLVEKFGLPSKPVKLNATYYVDRFGFVYFNVRGEITGLYSDEGHISGTGNYWQPAFVQSLEEFLQMPTDEITVYQEFLFWLRRYDSLTAARLVEAILADWDKKIIETNHSDNSHWAGEAFGAEKILWFWWCSLG
jgi:hypothetical protein